MTSLIPIIILAAGQSSRMRGADKLLQDVNGQPMLRHMTRMACSATDGVIVVALPPQPHARWGAIAHLDVMTVAVPDAAEGMNASLRRAIRALPQGSKGAMILLADLADLTEYDMKSVLQHADNEQEYQIVRGASETGIPGHPVVFSRTLFPQLLALKGDAGARSVVSAHADQVRLVPLPGQHATLDLDTPEDWAAWRAGHYNPSI